MQGAGVLSCLAMHPPEIACMRLAIHGESSPHANRLLVLSDGNQRAGTSLEGAFL